MSWTLTSNYSLKKVDFDTEENTWGDILNGNLDIIDANLNSGSLISPPIGSIFAWHKTYNQKATGTNSGTGTNQLIDGTATFQTNGIQTEMIIYNQTDNTWSAVLSVDSETTLTLESNIFLATGKTYFIYATPKLAANWVECNGQTLNDSLSPYNGQVIPNLNGDQRFLRGGAISGVLQSDAFQGHWHRYKGNPTNYTTTTGSTYGSATNSTITLPNNIQEAISDGVNGTPRTASETRPINMSVLWIMRVR
ncbi:MAG: hypothetical protein OEV44_14800 [Spirochaetota bacterium]|nr:hypothetical protein [Spirochaetota bacterium]